MQTVPARSYPLPRVLLMPQPGPLGRLIKRRRAELGLTQPELAEIVGCGQNDISRLESGRTQRVNDLGRLDALARALGLEDDISFILAAYAPREAYERWRQGAGTREALVAIPDDASQIDERTREYIHRFLALPAEQRRYIEGAIDFTGRETSQREQPLKKP